MLSPYQVFETSTGPLIIAVGNDRLFQKLAEVIGRPELGDDSKFKTNKDRVLNKRELVSIVGQAVYPEGREVWMERLEAAGVPCVPVQTVSEVFHHPQTKALNIIQQPPDNKNVSLVCSPLNINGKRPALRNAAPDIGQNQEEVLGRTCGMEQD
jgi:crotonobetainyl-CoA:carnitine CoA-transferase CaiB-like acyl-CoA transferase